MDSNAVGSVFSNRRKLYQAESYMHISIDDVINTLEDITKNQYKSIFHQPILAFLKNLHNEYGTVFSLYCFYEKDAWNLSQMTDKFIDEFTKASDWLKLSFHGKNYSSRYDDESIKPEQALEDCKQAINEIIRFAGEASIDTIPRIHFCSGKIKSAQKWRDYMLKGFLGADDDRKDNLYLDEVQRQELIKYGDWYDVKENLYNLKTHIRLEFVKDPYFELEQINTNTEFIDQQKKFIIFTHEQYLNKKEMQAKLLQVCSWANKNNVIFDYPQNHIPQEK
jgi:hypothetical protein